MNDTWCVPQLEQSKWTIPNNTGKTNGPFRSNLYMGGKEMEHPESHVVGSLMQGEQVEYSERRLC